MSFPPHTADFSAASSWRERIPGLGFWILRAGGSEPSLAVGGLSFLFFYFIFFVTPQHQSGPPVPFSRGTADATPLSLISVALFLPFCYIFNGGKKRFLPPPFENHPEPSTKLSQDSVFTPRCILLPHLWFPFDLY